MIAALDYIIRVMCGTIMLALVLLISLEVMLRFFFDLPIDWIVEVAVLLFVWMSMLGAAAAVPAAAHMALRPLSARLGPAGARLLSVFVSLLIVAFGLFLLVSGYGYVQSLNGEVMPVSGLPSAWGAADFPVAGALMMIFGLYQIFTALRTSNIKPRPLPVLPTPSEAGNAHPSGKVPC